VAKSGSECGNLIIDFFFTDWFRHVLMMKALQDRNANSTIEQQGSI
jgi:hypothetical protein